MESTDFIERTEIAETERHMSSEEAQVLVTSWSRGDLAFVDAWKAFQVVAGNHEILTASEEVELSQRIERGDLEAKSTMVTSNLRLVMSVAEQYQGLGLDMPDLCQEGSIGLMRAVEKFDYRQGNKFSTYGVLWIRQALQRAVHNKARMIRLPRDMEEDAMRTMKAENRLSRQYGHELSEDEIAEAAELTAERLAELRHYTQSLTSLDVPIGEEDDAPPLIEMKTSAADTPREAQVAIGRQVVRRAIASLSDPRARTIIEQFFGINEDETERPVSEIARELGLSQNTGSKLFRGALQTLASHEDLTPDLFPN